MTARTFVKNKRGSAIVAAIILILVVTATTTVFEKFYESNTQWHVGNGWGICGGYGTKYLKQVPTDIYPALYEYFHLPRNTVNAFESSSEATAVDPQKESSVPHICTGPLVNIEGTDPTISQIVTTPSTRKAEIAKTLANDRVRYSGVIPPGSTKAIQILISENVAWPNYSGHDPYVFNLQIDGNYVLTQMHDLVLGYYPKRGWKVVFEYAKSDAPFSGYPPTGS